MVPDKVRVATDEYLADQDVNPPNGSTSAPKRTTGPFAFETTRALFQSWKTWAEDRNFVVGTQTSLTDSLIDRGGYVYKRTTSKRGFSGIRLRFTAAPRLRTAN